MSVQAGVPSRLSLPCSAHYIPQTIVSSVGTTFLHVMLKILAPQWAKPCKQHVLNMQGFPWVCLAPEVTWKQLDKTWVIGASFSSNTSPFAVIRCKNEIIGVFLFFFYVIYHDVKKVRRYSLLSGPGSFLLGSSNSLPLPLYCSPAQS